MSDGNAQFIGDVSTADLSGDGVHDTRFTSIDGDAAPEIVEYDLDGDGVAEYIEADTNEDGIADVAIADMDNNGTADVAAVDHDHDGVVDEIIPIGQAAGAPPVSAAPVAPALPDPPLYDLPGVSSETQAVMNITNQGVQHAHNLYQSVADPGSVSDEDIAAAHEHAERAGALNGLMQAEIVETQLSTEIQQQEMNQQTIEGSQQAATEAWLAVMRSEGYTAEGR